MSTSLQTVRDLRRHWKPHKERLAAVRDEHPTAIRFHRACSWISEVELLDRVRHADQILLYQWVAFNALYGQWDQAAHEPAPDRRSWQAFLGRIHKLDRSGHLINVLQDHKPLVLCILEDEYLNQYFWEDPSPQSAGKARNGRHKAQSQYVEGRWLNILEQLVTRIYFLRCQLTHGAATCGSSLNRSALKHCVTMMGWLLPAILQVWIDHGAGEDWGAMCYAPVQTGHSVLKKR
jgi:hypothetical protein